jgi:hypothetical protein
MRALAIADTPTHIALAALTMGNGFAYQEQSWNELGRC